jgi:AcrR family transcriptional regulator
MTLTLDRADPPQSLAPREAILAQARIAFVEKGFDGASMQDLARAAGMSAGNFYRYFPSKAAIVEALVARELDQINLHFAMIERAPDPMAAIHMAIRARLSDELPETKSLWAEIMAAAHRRPEIAAALISLEMTVQGHILRLFALLRGEPEDHVVPRYATHARFLMLLIRGIEMEECMGLANPELTELVLTQIGRVLTDIIADKV